MLHIKSTVSFFILEVTNYEPLVNHILLVCKAQSALKMYLFLKADATVSIFMIIMYTYLVSLTLVLFNYFICICIGLHICILPGVMCYILSSLILFLFFTLKYWF